MTFSPVLDGKFVVSNEVQIMIEGEIVEHRHEPAGGAANAWRDAMLHRPLP